MDDEPKQWPTPSDILKEAKKLCETQHRLSPRNAIGRVGPELYIRAFRHEPPLEQQSAGFKSRPATEKAEGFWQLAFLEIFDKAIALAEKEETDAENDE